MVNKCVSSLHLLRQLVLVFSARELSLDTERIREGEQMSHEPRYIENSFLTARHPPVLGIAS